MKRKTKNIICCVVAILLIGSIIFTLLYAKKNIKSNFNKSFDEMKENIGNIPEKSDNDSGSSESSDKSNIPEKPSGDFDSSKMPEKPSGDVDSSKMPEKPSGDFNPENMPSMPNDDFKINNSNKLTIGYYIVISIESLLLCFDIMYLVLTKFNKKKIENKFVFIGVSFASAIILTLGIILITNNLVLKPSLNAFDKPNINSNVEYSSENKVTETSTINDKEYNSTKSDNNALLFSGNIDVNVNKISVTKTGDSDGGDNTSFYGINSAIIAKDGANITLKNINVTTNATGANGVFSYGGSATTNNSKSDGTTINISNSTIITKKDNSGGIMTTGGGVTNAKNLTITTSGISSAAIRSDRGGGTVSVDGGTYKTTGKGSPSIYSTADITVKNSKLISTASEGIVIEGKNSVSIENTQLTDTNSQLNGQSTTYKNVFLYQSMSGDADDGLSTFTAKNSTITTNKGDSFYITNTKAKIILSNNKITNNDKSGNFLRAKSDSWGTNGSNGGNVTLEMNNQTVSGNIVIDSVSTLEINMSSSNYTGTINKDKTAKKISVSLDKNSKIKLTGDSYITSLSNKDTSNSNIDFNGYKLYVNNKSIN